MKPTDIKVGETYANRGAGRTLRKVIAIGPEHRPKRFLGVGEPPIEDGVLFEQNGKQDTLYISSFAAWCGKLAEAGNADAAEKNKPKKLSAAQQDVLDLLNDGWELGVTSRMLGGGAMVQKGGVGKGGESRTVHRNVYNALWNGGHIVRIRDDYPTVIYGPKSTKTPT